MLSDEQMDREIREHVEKHPVILPEDYQTMVQNQIKKCCEGEMSMSQNKCRQSRCRYIFQRIIQKGTAENE